ncbi:MAG: NERD domain-containing protein [Chloroflexi bacterium]|nr:NERD domain-containing protein [Chloroflexota bacterium]
MRIAGSATYLHDRARRRLSGGVLLLGGAVLLFALGAFTGGGLTVIGSGPVFLGLGGLVVGGLRLAAARRDYASSNLDAPVVGQLAGRLGDEYVYLRHVAVPDHRAEADGILLGPHGMLVVAIRRLEGDFSVRGHEWFALEAGGNERPHTGSPTWELMRPLRALQKVVREEGLGDVPVEGAVILTGGRLVNADLPGAAIVPVDHVAAYVAYLRPSEPIPPAAIEALFARLEPHAGGVKKK